MFDPSSFANPTPLAHADATRDALPRGGTSQIPERVSFQKCATVPSCMNHTFWRTVVHKPHVLAHRHAFWCTVTGIDCSNSGTSEKYAYV
ncbi:hypothetical protein TNCV_68581 [Trichonephila clavipes]|nr:hypothetical protein TNCV_68581 [Trichonephila clavipes]